MDSSNRLTIDELITKFKSKRDLYMKLIIDCNDLIRFIKISCITCLYLECTLLVL